MEHLKASGVESEEKLQVGTSCAGVRCTRCPLDLRSHNQTENPATLRWLHFRSAAKVIMPVDAAVWYMKSQGRTSFLSRESAASAICQIFPQTEARKEATLHHGSAVGPDVVRLSTTAGGLISGSSRTPLCVAVPRKGQLHMAPRSVTEVHSAYGTHGHGLTPNAV